MIAGSKGMEGFEVKEKNQRVSARQVNNTEGVCEGGNVAEEGKSRPSRNRQTL